MMTMMTTTTKTPRSNAHRAIASAFLLCLAALVVPQPTARAAPHGAAAINPCGVVTLAVAKTILGSAPRPGIPSRIPR